MTRRMLVFGVLVAATIGMSLGVAGATGATGAHRPHGPHIGPNQEFVGLVNGSNGQHEHAQIRVACPGPSSGETTHPLRGQTLAVTLPASTGGTVGNTGPRGRHVNVYQGIPPQGAHAASGGGLPTFTHYGVKKLPTSLVVPCSGSGYITFMAFPRDPGLSRPVVVPVDYVNVAA